MIAFEVNDMTCGRCVSAIAQAVRRVDDAAGCRSIWGPDASRSARRRPTLPACRRPSRKRVIRPRPLGLHPLLFLLGQGVAAAAAVEPDGLTEVKGLRRHAQGA